MVNVHTGELVQILSGGMCATGWEMWGNNANPVQNCLCKELIHSNSLGSNQPAAGAGPQTVYVGGRGWGWGVFSTTFHSLVGILCTTTSSRETS